MAASAFTCGGVITMGPVTSRCSHPRQFERYRPRRKATARLDRAAPARGSEFGPPVCARTDLDGGRGPGIRRVPLHTLGGARGHHRAGRELVRRQPGRHRRARAPAAAPAIRILRRPHYRPCRHDHARGGNGRLRVDAAAGCGVGARRLSARLVRVVSCDARGWRLPDVLPGLRPNRARGCCSSSAPFA